MEITSLNQYLTAYKSVVESITDNRLEFRLSNPRERSDSRHIAVIVGFIGDMTGQARFIMDRKVAMALSSVLAGGMEITEMDELVMSAISEFGNMVMGSTCTLFSNQGITVDITPPAIRIEEDCSEHDPTTLVFCTDILIEGIGLTGFDISLYKTVA